MKFFPSLRITPQNRRILIAIILVILIIVYFVLSHVFPKTSPSQDVPSLPSTTTIFPTPTSQPFTTPTLNIKWSLSQNPSLPEKIITYRLDQSLSSDKTQSTLPNALGFPSDSQNSNSTKTVFTWTNKKQSLIINTLKNTLLYSSGKTPSISKNIFIPDQTVSVSRKIISDLFGSEVGSSLTNPNIDYYHTQNIYSIPSTQNEADLVRVSFSQSIDNFHTVALSETSSNFIIYLDRNLDLYSFSINGAYLSISPSKEVPLFSFDNAKQNILSSQRLNASPDLATNFEIATSKNLLLTINDFKIAYIQINDSYLPVFLISGPLKSSTSKDQIGIYALPAASY